MICCALSTRSRFRSALSAARTRARFLRNFRSASVEMLSALWRISGGRAAFNPIRATPWPTVRFALGVAHADIGRFCKIARVARVRADAVRELLEEDTQPIPSVF